MLELRGMALMARTLSDTAKRCQARGREGPDWCDASFARFQFRPVPAHEWSAEAITLKANWINMYDKHGCVLGVETVINDPYEFKVRRRAGRRGAADSRVAPLAERRGRPAANFPRLDPGPIVAA